MLGRRFRELLSRSFGGYLSYVFFCFRCRVGGQDIFERKVLIG